MCAKVHVRPIPAQPLQEQPEWEGNMSLRTLPACQELCTIPPPLLQVTSLVHLQGGGSAGLRSQEHIWEGGIPAHHPGLPTPTPFPGTALGSVHVTPSTQRMQKTCFRGSDIDNTLPAKT